MTGEGSPPAAVAAPPGPLATLFQQALPGAQFEIVQTPLDETIVVQRDDLVRVMETACNHESLRFDFLRCLSGVDYITHMEVAYHLHSYSLQQSVGIKVRCPNDDLHVPTISHIWQAANWHERETHEMFGIVFDGHPDLRPLLTEEGLGYYPLRKSHPLAEIEEWQEDYVEAIARAKVSAQGAAGAAPAVDEKAAKIALAQKKAAAITKARDAARAKGLSPEDEKAAVQAAIKAVDEEEAAAAPAAAAPPPPVDERAAKIALAQKKAALITKTRNEARARGLSPEDERLAVAEALKKLAEEDAAAPPAAPAPAAAPPVQDRAAKIALAQKKAALITKTRNEARARGLSPEDERQVVAEALKKLAEEETGG
ncbi:MAG: NADH-quinone oxidoreductase subunit C [Dehalococcoidia bacterium]|nr:NADH-quinone oxidoreductase subunit C [Dehalococcoidia bacterium]